MTIRTREQLTEDFETLADTRYHPDVYAASARIMAHLTAIPEALKKPLTLEEVPDCCCSTVVCDAQNAGDVCPVMDTARMVLLPVLLKRIGAE